MRKRLENVFIPLTAVLLELVLGAMAWVDLKAIDEYLASTPPSQGTPAIYWLIFGGLTVSSAWLAHLCLPRPGQPAIVVATIVLLGSSWFLAYHASTMTNGGGAITDWEALLAVAPITIETLIIACLRAVVEMRRPV